MEMEDGNSNAGAGAQFEGWGECIKSFEKCGEKSTGKEQGIKEKSHCGQKRRLGLGMTRKVSRVQKHCRGLPGGGRSVRAFGCKRPFWRPNARKFGSHCCGGENAPRGVALGAPGWE